MADKLAHKFGGKVHQLKIGKSFDKKPPADSMFHTIRYDFKPLSVDEERMGVLEVGERNSVSVSLPNVGGSGQTNFKGNMKPANNKECVLIINHDTGELTLERLTNQMLVKKTRPEKPERNPLPPTKNEGERGGNPYEVKEVPEKPKPSSHWNGHNSSTGSGASGSSKHGNSRSSPSYNSTGLTNGSASHHNHLPPHVQHLSEHKLGDSDFSISPMNSAKSSPARGAKPNVQVDSLGRPIESSDSSDSSSSSDSGSDSEGGEEGDDAKEPDPLATLLSQDSSANSGGYASQGMPSLSFPSSGIQDQDIHSHRLSESNQNGRAMTGSQDAFRSETPPSAHESRNKKDSRSGNSKSRKSKGSQPAANAAPKPYQQPPAQYSDSGAGSMSALLQRDSPRSMNQLLGISDGLGGGSHPNPPRQQHNSITNLLGDDLQLSDDDSD